jgi:hypothetical protein
MEETWALSAKSAGGGNFRFSDNTELIDTSAVEEAAVCCALEVVSSVAIDARVLCVEKKKFIPSEVSGKVKNKSIMLRKKAG